MVHVSEATGSVLRDRLPERGGLHVEGADHALHPHLRRYRIAIRSRRGH